MRAWARVVLGWVTSWEVLGLHLVFSTSFLPVLPAADPRLGSSGPAGRASGWAGLHGEEMGPVRPLGGGAVALGGPLMMIVCAYIGSTSILPVLPAADPRPGSSAPAGRASGRAGLNGEKMGPLMPLGGGAVALGGALIMIVCAYIGRCDHTSTNAPDPIRTPQLSVLGRECTSFLTVLSAADPRPGSSAPAGRASGRAGLNGEEMGPAMPLGGGAVALGGPLMMIVCAYIGRCDHTSTNAPDPVRTPQLSVLGRECTSFLPILPAADPRLGSSAPAARASGRARLHREEMGLARPLGGGAVALGGAVMMIVCAYIGRCDHTRTNAPDPVITPHTSFLPVLPAADPRPGSSGPAGRASGWAGLHGEEMGPARPLGGGAVALGGPLMMIVCAYIGSTSILPVLPAADPRPGSSAPAGWASGRAGLHREEMGPARPLGGGAIALGGAIIPARMHRIPSELRSKACLGESGTRMGDLLGSPRVAPLFQYLFFTCPSGRQPSSRKLGSGGRASRRAGLNGEEMGPAMPLGGGAVALGCPLMMIVSTYIGRCDHTSTNAPDPARTPQLSYLFFTRPSGRRPSTRKLDSGGSGIRKGGAPWLGDGPRAASRWRPRCPRRPACDDCAIIPALTHRIPSELRSKACLGESGTRMGDLLGSPRVAPPFHSAPAGRASGRAGLNGEEMGPAMPLGGGAVALGGPLMMIVCAYIGRCDHTRTNAPDPVRTPHTSFLPVLPASDPRPGSSAPAGRASGRAGLHGEEMGPARPFCSGAVALGAAVMMIVCAYIGRCDHTRTNAPDPVRTP
ncbi:hypothetical protein PIB30_102664, partial [Stylosanthes scabra]|nr:hypothetical protein [Stylosanthes scabra]